MTRPHILAATSGCRPYDVDHIVMTSANTVACSSAATPCLGYVNSRVYMDHVTGRRYLNRDVIVSTHDSSAEGITVISEDTVVP